MEQHYRQLEAMYAAAPINDFYKPALSVAEGVAEIEIEVTEKMHHSAGAMHGSVYFKMLDDAAFFAASSMEARYFVLTTSFTIYLTRPVVAGQIRAVGKVVNSTRTQFIAEAVLYDQTGEEVARGSGVFARSRQKLENALGYGTIG